MGLRGCWCISQTVLKMNQYKNLAEDYIFNTKPEVSLEMMPVKQFFVGGKKGRKCFLDCLGEDEEETNVIALSYSQYCQCPC